MTKFPTTSSESKTFIALDAISIAIAGAADIPMLGSPDLAGSGLA